MCVVVTAAFHPIPDRREELVAALTESIPAVHAEEGCRLYAIHDASDGTILMIEKWDSDELLKTHAQGSAVAALNAATSHLVASPTTVITMRPLPAGSDEQGVL